MATCRLPGCTNDVDGRADKQFCCLAHKQKYWRDQQKKDQAQGTTFTAMLSELVELRATVADQAERIAEMEQQMARLRSLLDIERRYHADHERRSFKAWLKKQPAHAIGDLGQRLLTDDLMPPMASRAGYEARLRSHGYSPEVQQEFAHLWKLMLLQS